MNIYKKPLNEQSLKKTFSLPEIQVNQQQKKERKVSFHTNLLNISIVHVMNSNHKFYQTKNQIMNSTIKINDKHLNSPKKEIHGTNLNSLSYRKIVEENVLIRQKILVDSILAKKEMNGKKWSRDSFDSISIMRIRKVSSNKTITKSKSMEKGEKKTVNI